MQETRDKIKEMLAEKVGIDTQDVEEELLLQDGLALSAADLAEVLELMAEELGIKIPDQETENLKTVKDLLDAAENYGQEF